MYRLIFSSGLYSYAVHTFWMFSQNNSFEQLVNYFYFHLFLFDSTLISPNKYCLSKTLQNLANRFITEF